jgi:type I restriction enzyme S subunit
MTEGRPTRSLGELCAVVGGGTPSKSNPGYYDGTIPWATVRDMQQDTLEATEHRITREAVASSSTNVIPSGNVVIATRVGLGKVCILGQDTAINQDLRGIIPLSESVLNVRYLFWWLKSVSSVIVAEGTGATVQGVKLPFIKNLRIPLPTLVEQQRIVRLLDEAFEGIAIAKVNAEKNLQNARALFESHLQSVFAKSVAISMNWPIKTLGEVCQLKPAKSEARARLSAAADVSFVPMEDLGINDKWVKALKSRPLSDVAGSYTYFAEGDVLLAKITPCFENGKLGIATNLINGVGFGSSEYFVLRPDAAVSAEFLYHYLNRDSFRLEGAARMSGAVGHRRVTREFIESYPIPVPSRSEQQRIISNLDELVGASDALTSSYVKKLAALDDLQKSLLNQAFRGELEAA